MIVATRRAMGPPPKYLPTPAEIETVCAKIQVGWSATERLKRRHGLIDGTAEEIDNLAEQVAWCAPTIDTTGLSRSEAHLFTQA